MSPNNNKAIPNSNNNNSKNKQALTSPNNKPIQIIIREVFKAIFK
jgi:hypothetical protein